MHSLLRNKTNIYYYYNFQKMKKLYFLVIALCFLSTAKAQIITFPDANFKAKLLLSSTSNSIAENLQGNNFKIDANNDGEIQLSEALQVKDLDVYYSSITSLVGVENFSNMTALHCSGNQIATLNLTNMPKLVFLDCEANRISSLDVSALIGLRTLWCQLNVMTSLNLGGLPNLETIYCNNNRISSLNLSGLTSLSFLDCNTNYLTNLDASPAVNLVTLYSHKNRLSTINVAGLSRLNLLHCYTNFLTTIDVSNLTNLASFWCYSNLLKTIDVSSLTKLSSFSCSSNRLTSLFMKNGRNESFAFDNNPNLAYVCVDESQLAEVQLLLNPQSCYPCYYPMHFEVNTYCSFTPGGTLYTMQGNAKYDATANGCDVNDTNYPRLKFSISNGTLKGTLISDLTGNYFLPLEAGTYTITPILENPTYYNVSPASVNVSFPTQGSPLNQNFCITRNGAHNDLGIMMYPISAARPGFDATYQIYYKNNGFNSQSGTVNLSFNDAVLDLVSSNPTAASTVNNLSWSFTNLLPFESRVITVTLNVNSPMEIPAVNSGSVLAYKATITSAAIDETPIDNTFTFNQTVVNSFDPNDKTCLEGSIISPSLIGQYVHYMIRFENTGTFPAQNIVVKDMIDLSKFDISTLVPTNASHSYVTKISAGNKVEFIFENINLPFDDANNDGFITFKIKTLPTLVVGTTFTNAASIYFDYNFPVVTKLASSTFKTLGTPDFEFSNYFTLYPNPVQSVLNISSKEGIEMKSISIYNTLGQLVLVIPDAEKVSKIDVSSLTTGNYFIKINSDKGTSNTRFIKE
jgi:hypothetical protein